MYHIVSSLLCRQVKHLQHYILLEYFLAQRGRAAVLSVRLVDPPSRYPYEGPHGPSPTVFERKWGTMVGTITSHGIDAEGVYPRLQACLSTAQLQKIVGRDEPGRLSNKRHTSVTAHGVSTCKGDKGNTAHLVEAVSAVPPTAWRGVERVRGRQQFVQLAQLCTCARASVPSTLEYRENENGVSDGSRCVR